MVSVSGVRGIIGEGLTPDVVMTFAQAFGEFVKQGKVVVGRDSRVSGEMMKSAVVAGLASVGCDVLDIGICPTPTTQLAVEKLEADGGVMITASHNPIMWNGLKLIGADGLFLDAEQGEQVLKLAEKKTFAFAPWDKIGVMMPYSNAIQDHIESILNLTYFDIEQIQRRHFKIVLDCVCGAGANLLPHLLYELGCTVTSLNCEPTGLFPRNPEPLPENLTEICDAVKAAGADLGIAVDPDSDRLALVSDKGEAIGEEKTLALAVHFILSRTKGPVVINASTSRMTEDIAEKYGASVIRTRVGEVHVAKKMREVEAVIGGEGNGGVILPDLHLGRDAPVGVALILQLLTQFEGSLSELDASLPQYVITKTKVELQGLDPESALQKVKEAFADEELDFTDGVKLIRDKAWVQIRPSNTEPIIRIIAEARTKAESERLCDEVKGLIKN